MSALQCRLHLKHCNLTSPCFSAIPTPSAIACAAAVELQLPESLSTELEEYKVNQLRLWQKETLFPISGSCEDARGSVRNIRLKYQAMADPSQADLVRTLILHAHSWFCMCAQAAQHCASCVQVGHAEAVV